MKRHVMQPFRAPRHQKGKASPTRQSPRQQGKQDKEVHAIPEQGQQNTSESEEPTESGLVWEPVIIKETQYNENEELNENVIGAPVDRSLVVHDKQPAILSTAASPSCSEFEAFLESKSVPAIASEACVSGGAHKNNSKTDAY
jgi:hypothetical protein